MTSPAQLKLGRRPPHPETTHPRLKLGPFLKGDYTGAVPDNVNYLSLIDTWPMYANDRIGDCTTAAAGHMEEVWSKLGAHDQVTPTTAQVISMYSAVTGYSPNNSATDRGAVMQDVLSYWRKTGLATHKIAAFAQLDHRDLAQVQAAMYLFGGVYVGVNCPRSALAQFNNGQAWTYHPDVDNTIAGGHCVHLGAFSRGGFTVTTWGATQRMDTAWWRAFTEEAWVPISLEWVSHNSSPEHLDVPALNAAFEQLTGQPGPFPAPAPPVPPTPPGPPSKNPDVVLVDKLGCWAAAWPHTWPKRQFNAWRRAKGL